MGATDGSRGRRDKTTGNCREQVWFASAFNGLHWKDRFGRTSSPESLRPACAATVTTRLHSAKDETTLAMASPQRYSEGRAKSATKRDDCMCIIATGTKRNTRPKSMPDPMPVRVRL